MSGNLMHCAMTNDTKLTCTGKNIQAQQRVEKLLRISKAETPEEVLN